VDWKEGLDIGTQAGSLDDKGLDGWNQWPSKPPEFEGIVRDYFWQMEALARKLTCCMSLGLGMDAEHFSKEFDGVHSSYLRMNYYPLCPDPSSHMAISHHTDAGAVTVLTQSMVRSLQVYQPSNDQWYDVEPIEGAFVINTGDIMQVWSNDVYKAPLHRVKAQENLERYSSPFFYNPSYDTT
jgi:isopenicillin N synthase-like dioxygenase